MDDPTQTPPFSRVAVITDGTVTGWAGIANAHWVESQGDPALVLAPDDTREGDTYDPATGTFTRPAQTPEDTNG